jgi:hypothetical protein
MNELQISVRRASAPPGILALIVFEAATLAVVSSLHLAGATAKGKPPFDATSAGIAEAVICLVLILSIASNLRRSPSGWLAAVAAVTFTIVGFLVGLTFTLRGGSSADIAYHTSMLPILIATLALLLRSPDPTTNEHTTTIRCPPSAERRGLQRTQLNQDERRAHNHAG